MIYSYKEFIKGIILEELHPELQEIIKSPESNKSKKDILAKKIKSLSQRGEKTGIEGNMPHGSSRAYLQHEDPENIILDGKPTKVKSGIKVAIKSSLDDYHDRGEFGSSLGSMQNEVEGGDHLVNRVFRILTHDHTTNEFHSNKDGGIFPPLFDHDYENHEWSHVGHVNDVSKKAFKNLTKVATHPEGISHDDFNDALERATLRERGKYWKGTKEQEKKIDHIESHPLVERFKDYHLATGNPSTDYRQIKNMGVFNHPDGAQHIVARDHGFGEEVSNSYRKAMQNKFKTRR